MLAYYTVFPPLLLRKTLQEEEQWQLLPVVVIEAPWNTRAVVHSPRIIEEVGTWSLAVNCWSVILKDHSTPYLKLGS